MDASKYNFENKHTFMRAYYDDIMYNLGNGYPDYKSSSTPKTMLDNYEKLAETNYIKYITDPSNWTKISTYGIGDKAAYVKVVNELIIDLFKKMLNV